MEEVKNRRNATEEKKYNKNRTDALLKQIEKEKNAFKINQNKLNEFKKEFHALYHDTSSKNDFTIQFKELFVKHVLEMDKLVEKKR